MPERLLTSRAELDAALLQLLPLARQSIRIFDGDLSSFPLENPERIALLQEFLLRPNARLTLVLQHPAPSQAGSPRLVQLARQYSHAFTWLQAPESLSNLQDAMLLADAEHALVRFHREQPRGKCIEADARACHPYGKRFEAILAEGCSAVTHTPLGL